MKMWELYYTVDENNVVRDKMYKQDKVDLFNVLTGNVFKTELEAQADIHKQSRRLEKAREVIDGNFAKRFYTHLDKTQ